MISSRRLSKFSPNVVNLLRLLWIVLIAWYELGTFYQHVAQCAWPTSSTILSSPSFDSTTQPQTTHALLVADPQVLDHRSYPGRAPWLMTLSQYMVDLNLRKSWTAVKSLKPSAVMFLGDMMDGGRFAMSDVEYESYYARFKSIFSLPESIPVHYIPGNHDLGIGTSTSFSDRASSRYTTHFGPLNQVLEYANYTFVLIDAPGLVEEDEHRTVRGVSYTQWATSMPGGPIEFVHSFDSQKYNNPLVLLIHIPLARPEGASCGPLRERGTIRQGFGFGYQNTLSAQVSQYLLEKLRPVAIFSGDDHDYCEYHHTLPASDEVPLSVHSSVKEITVKSFSMAMGVRKPGFQLLSLFPPSSTSTLTTHQRSAMNGSSDQTTLQDLPCLLPDQLQIYVSIYLPCILFSFVVLFLTNLLRVNKMKDIEFRSAYGAYDAYPDLSDEPLKSGWLEPPGAIGFGEWRSTTPTTLDMYGDRLPPHLQVESDEDHDELEDNVENGYGYDYRALPLPGGNLNGRGAYGKLSRALEPSPSRSKARKRVCHWSWSFVLWGRRRRVTVDGRSCLSSLVSPFFSSPSSSRRRMRFQRRGLLSGFVGDVARVGWPPLLLFGAITWWMFW